MTRRFGSCPKCLKPTIILEKFDYQDWLDTTKAKSIQLKMLVIGEPGYFDAEVQQVELDAPDGGWDRVTYPEFFWWREEHNIPQEPPDYITPTTTRCPRCYSSQIVIGYPEIVCRSCGYSEPLIDYPISYSTHRSLSREHGWPDPGPDMAPEPVAPPEQVIVHRHSDMGREDYDLLQQTALRVQHLEGQLKELKAKRKPKRYQQYKNS